MKIKILAIALLIIIFYLPAFSQTISFNAVDTLSGAQLNLDSVNIKCSRYNIDTTLIADFILTIPNLTQIDYNNNSNYSFRLEQNYPNAFEDYTCTYLTANITGNYIIALYNILGECILQRAEFLNQGRYTIELNCTNLNSGIYFLKVSNGLFTNTIKMMKQSNSQNSSPSCNILIKGNEGATGGKNKEMLLSNESFTFTGYVKGYYPSIIEKDDFQDDEQFTFKMNKKPLAESFSSGKITLSGFKGEFRNISFWRAPPDDSSLDTSYLVTDIFWEFEPKTCLLEQEYWYYSLIEGKFLGCKDKKYLKDTMSFCCEEFNEENDMDNNSWYRYSKSLVVSIVFDTSSSTISTLYVHLFNHNYADIYMANELKDEHWVIVIKNLSYSFNDNGNLEASLTFNEFFNSIESLSYTYQYSKYNNEYIDKTSTNLLKYYDFNENSFIKIELYP